MQTVLSLAKPWAKGFWPINGCSFGPDGSFYVSELSNDPSVVIGGDVVKVSFEHPQKRESLTNSALTTPGGVAVSWDGTVYVANATAYYPTGQVCG
jgi:sugar lactone lactonase YvrE